LSSFCQINAVREYQRNTERVALLALSSALVRQLGSNPSDSGDLPCSNENGIEMLLYRQKCPDPNDSTFSDRTNNVNTVPQFQASSRLHRLAPHLRGTSCPAYLRKLLSSAGLCMHIQADCTNPDNATIQRSAQNLTFPVRW
jgi:hypothetical protein